MNYFYSFIADFSPLVFYSLWALLLLIFYVVKKETDQRFIKMSLWIFFLTTVLVIASQALSIYLQYQQTYLRFLLTRTDFYWVKVTRLIVSQVISVFFALFFSLIIFFFAKKTRQEIIDALDVFLLSFSLLVLGWPNFLLFLILLFVMAVVGGLIQVARKKSNLQARFILTPYILPAFLLILWFGNFLAKLTWLDKIRF